MALVSAAPVLTSRGDELNSVDGFIADFGIKQDGDESTVIEVGNCDDLVVDSDTGFIGMRSVLFYTDLLSTAADTAGLKKCVAAWFKKPASVAISSTLLKRDRGASQFPTTSDFFVHPTQLLANVEVGASTRTWLISTAAFAMSFHQIIKAHEESPQDFAQIDDHIEALTLRAKVLKNRGAIGALAEAALSSTKPPYPDFNYHSVVRDVLSRLALLARTDLEVMKHIKEEMEEVKPSKKKSVTTEISIPHLNFLKDELEANGDLWFERSAHTYENGDISGALIVFPSGYIYSVVGAEGVSARKLMRKRCAMARMESLIPYIPFEFSGYSGDISRMAHLEAVQRNKKTPAKMDFEAARAAIASYAVRLAGAIIVNPLMIELVGKMKIKMASQDASSVSSTRTVTLVPAVEKPKSSPTMIPEQEEESSEVEE